MINELRPLHDGECKVLVWVVPVYQYSTGYLAFTRQHGPSDRVGAGAAHSW